MREKAVVIGTLFLSVTCIVGVEIRHMRVPSVLESGSRPYVILDCDYDLSDSEGHQVDVKWFFGSDPQPFYQWLPGRPPQTIGKKFKNRIDLDYEVSGADRFRKHRALKIWKPTTELSGTYRCKVSSFVDEDFMQKSMIVYSPPKDVSLIYTQPDENHINLTCAAHGIYPKPDIDLSWGKRHRGGERGETTTLTVERNGLFDIAVNKILRMDDLVPQTVFQCLLSIPDTHYSVKEETMYFPGKVLPQLTASSESCHTSKCLLVTSATLVASVSTLYHLLKHNWA